jgi:hypothetical protein
MKHIADGELDDETMADLRDVVETLGYTARDTIFDGSERDALVCIPNKEETAIVKNIVCNMGFPKIEHELSANIRLTCALWFGLMMSDCQWVGSRIE